MLPIAFRFVACGTLLWFGLALPVQAQNSIYGTITIAGVGTPLGGVRMDGLPGTPYTNSAGAYAMLVPSGWSGKVTPSYNGYTFSPPSRTYANVTAMQPDQNYVATPISGGWSSDPTVNTPVCTWTANQENVRITPDGSGGGILVYTDQRTPSAKWLYAQRVDAGGSLKWYPPSMAITAYNCSGPVITSDGMGGAIVAWADTRFNQWRVYAQRISRQGAKMWGTYGVALGGGGTQTVPAVIGDGAGGGIIAWADDGNVAGAMDVKVQHINAEGQRSWNGPYAVTVCNASGVQDNPVVAADGAGGVIVAWQDARAGTANWDIYAQRVNAAGIVQWPVNGIPVVGAAGNQQSPVIDADENGGAVLAWVDSRTPGSQSVYTQRIGSSGSTLWGADGILISGNPQSQMAQIVGDGNGGAFVAWCDNRLGLMSLWLQHADASGTILWESAGVSPSVSVDQAAPRLIQDGAGGVIVTWFQLDAQVHVYAQRLTESADRLWPDYTVVCAAPSVYPVLASDGANGAVIAWVDQRLGYSDLNIYAARMLGSGARAGLKGNIAGTVSCLGVGLGQVTTSLLNSQGNRVWWVPTVRTDAGGHYVIPNLPPGSFSVAVFEPLGYDAGGNPTPVAVYADYTTTVDFSLTQSVAENASRMKAYWEHQFSVYVDHQGTAQESEEQLYGYMREVAEHYSPHFAYFRGAWSPEEWLGFLRLPEDPSPFELARAQVAALALNLAALRVGQYTPVTRDGRTAGDVLTCVSQLLASSKANDLAHAMAYSQHVNNRVIIRAGAIPQGSILYKTPGDGWSRLAEKPSSFVLRDNYPNPFNPSTTIRFDVPQLAHVSIVVYNAIGQKVAQLVESETEAGFHSVKFDASALPSGVYFCRMDARSVVEGQGGSYLGTRKLLLVR